jgi:hypothetical protein
MFDKKIQAYVLGYCPLSQRLVNVRSGDPSSVRLAKERWDLGFASKSVVTQIIN